MSTRRAPQEPMLMTSGLTSRVYLVTSYTQKAEGQFVAHKKTDVTAFLATAWDEGYQAGWSRADAGYAPEPINPYRSTTP